MATRHTLQRETTTCVVRQSIYTVFVCVSDKIRVDGPIVQRTKQKKIDYIMWKLIRRGEEKKINEMFRMVYEEHI